ncbi:sensor histidine kinase [Arachidicoccus sp.]|uniref:sensor histidine kinase n=1 Tax=Arachidicoccus sp. TaxID=1872624 RepID=UPI003D25519C
MSIIEGQRMGNWVEAHRTIANATDETSLNLAGKISSENEDIPIIETNERDSITNNYFNIDSIAVKNDPHYLLKKLKQFKKLHKPIVLKLSTNPLVENKYYYGETILQKELRYFSIIQLLIVAFFIGFIVVAQRMENRGTQNRLWVGMAKETAHQLGTPLSSLSGWLEILKNIPGNEMVLPEMEKDIERLKLVSDRFAKIGSYPKMEEKDVVAQIRNMVEYIRKRAGGNIKFSVTSSEKSLYAPVSPPLFDWVIENLLKNALDAMDGYGNIDIKIKQLEQQIFIDIADTGKGINYANQKKIFNPGFTTKKRGWGLGLALSKRIIYEYHHGNIFIRSSEIGKGTIFRIVLNI